jgi:FkbH-like protein
MEQKKCLVLDLDNTLWGGVIGEDGLDGIKLSMDAPGNSFLAFQQAIRDLHDRGVILAVNSRNNPEDALAVIRTHPNMLLKEQHFAALRMNWNDKAENLKEIADELNIGLDSLVFLDDDPTNRALVRSLLPMVEVPELPEDSREYARFLASLPYFPSAATTDEDQMRGNLYVTERLRRSEEERHATKEDFLASLGLSLTMARDDASTLTRLAQMTGKTNQFNFDKRPYSEEELAALVANPATAVIHGRLADRFGDYGIVALAIAEMKGDAWHLPAMLMSCRALGRGVEEAFFGAVLEAAKAAGAKEVSIAFTEAERNQPAKAFLDAHFEGNKRSMEESFAAPSWVAVSHA